MDEMKLGYRAEYRRGFEDARRLAQREAESYGRNVPMGRMYADRIATFIRDIQPPESR